MSWWVGGGGANDAPDDPKLDVDDVRAGRRDGKGGSEGAVACRSTEEARGGARAAPRTPRPAPRAPHPAPHAPRTVLSGWIRVAACRQPMSSAWSTLVTWPTIPWSSSTAPRVKRSARLLTKEPVPCEVDASAALLESPPCPSVPNPGGSWAPDMGVIPTDSTPTVVRDAKRACCVSVHSLWPQGVTPAGRAEPPGASAATEESMRPVVDESCRFEDDGNSVPLRVDSRRSSSPADAAVALRRSRRSKPPTDPRLATRSGSTPWPAPPAPAISARLALRTRASPPCAAGAGATRVPTTARAARGLC